MIRRPFGSVNSSNAMRPDGAGAAGEAARCAASVAGSIDSRTHSLRMGPRLHREERQRVGFEDSLLLLVRKRQGQELIDVLPEVFHAGAGPIRPPQHTVA